jgi:hypothetical protein
MIVAPLAAAKRLNGLGECPDPPARAIPSATRVEQAMPISIWIQQLWDMPGDSPSAIPELLRQVLSVILAAIQSLGL